MNLELEATQKLFRKRSIEVRITNKFNLKARKLDNNLLKRTKSIFLFTRIRAKIRMKYKLEKTCGK